MRERPILFSEPMVQALLAGRKTVTRRVSKLTLQPVGATHPGYFHVYGLPTHRDEEGPPGYGFLRLDQVAAYCPYGESGDRLWVVTIKPVAGYEDRYGAGDDGNVYRTDRGEPRRMRPGTTTKGYRTVTLCRDGMRTTALVHQLVCESFYGARPAWAHEVRHLDGDRTNNRPENLDWGTREQNWSDKRAAGKSIHGNHHAAKLTVGQVEKIRDLAAAGEPKRALARRFGLAQSTVQGICSGKTWKAPPPPAPTNMPRWASRLTLEVVSVRLERLHDITEEDARREGVFADDVSQVGVPCYSARQNFEKLWVTINGAESWDANPWVWVEEFRRLEVKRG